MLTFNDFFLMKASKRTELYTVADFLAICGGLLGFFVGASMLSIIEFAYFSTIHLFWKIRLAQPRNVVAPSNDTVDNAPSTGDQNMYVEDIEEF